MIELQTSVKKMTLPVHVHRNRGYLNLSNISVFHGMVYFPDAVEDIRNPLNK
jgi:hypothetical protein